MTSKDNRYEYAVFQDSLEENLYYLGAGLPNDVLAYELRATENLRINNFQKLAEDIYLLKGSYQGELLVDQQPISNNQDDGEFNVQIDRQGKILGTTLISGQGYLGMSSLNSESDYYLVESSQEEFIVDGRKYTSFISGSIIEVTLKEDVVSLNSDFRVTGTMMLQSTETSIDNELKYYAFYGTGEVFFKGSLVENTSRNELVFISINQNTRKVYRKYTNYIPNLSYLVPNMELDKFNNIYMVANVNSGSDILDENLPNPSGGNDILAMQFDYKGKLVKEWFYPTTDYEEAVDIFYSGNYLFIGGNISGDLISRKIGDLTFNRFTSTNTNGFITYVDLRSESNPMSEGCDFDCSSNIDFVPNTCGARVTISGPDIDNFYLVVRSDNGYQNTVGFLETGDFNYQITEPGEYEFNFLSGNYPCEDQIYYASVTGDCPDQLCSSINNSATGRNDWSSTFTADGDGFLTLIFNTVSVPDQLRVYKNGILYSDSGYYSTNRSNVQVGVLYPGCNTIAGDGNPYLIEVPVEIDDIIEIQVIADNCGILSTVWYLDAECSGTSNAINLLTRSRERIVEEDDLRICQIT